MYWLKVITCLGVVCIVDCESISDCMMKSFGSSLPFACLCVVLLFCDDHQIIDVNRSERFSRSTGEW